VGGKSLTWGGITLRLSDFEFKAAERDGHGPSWPIGTADLAPYYGRLERLLGVHGQRDGLPQARAGRVVQGHQLPVVARDGGPVGGGVVGCQRVFGGDTRLQVPAGQPVTALRGLQVHEAQAQQAGASAAADRAAAAAISSAASEGGGCAGAGSGSGARAPPRRPLPRAPGPCIIGAKYVFRVARGLRSLAPAH
jgi:choline dehydrogenase-like flavoprotein